MIDVLLINPAYFDPAQEKKRRKDYKKWIRGGNMYVLPFEPPLGLAHVYSHLVKKNLDARLLDMQGLRMDMAALERAVKHFAQESLESPP